MATKAELEEEVNRLKTINENINKLLELKNKEIVALKKKELRDEFYDIKVGSKVYIKTNKRTYLGNLEKETKKDLIITVEDKKHNKWKYGVKKSLINGFKVFAKNFKGEVKEDDWKNN